MRSDTTTDKRPDLGEVFWPIRRLFGPAVVAGTVIVLLRHDDGSVEYLTYMYPEDKEALR
jgi:hypothetical protein